MDPADSVASDGATATGSNAEPAGGGTVDGGAAGGDAADAEAAKSLKGKSLGQLLSGGTERVASAKPAASTDAGTRAAKAVSDEGGGAGLLWLLLALGAVTAVAAGGVAVRRRQARQSYLN